MTSWREFSRWGECLLLVLFAQVEDGLHETGQFFLTRLPSKAIGRLGYIPEVGPLGPVKLNGGSTGAGAGL